MKQECILNEEFFKKEMRIYIRRCLKCDKKFETDNKFYRLCPYCRKIVTESNWLEN